MYYKKKEITYIINIDELEHFLKIIKKATIIYIYFENKLQNNFNINNYLQIIVFYINNKIYILNLVFIIENNIHYGIILLKRFMDLINKESKIKIMFKINQIDLLYNFIIKYKIKNINKKMMKNYVCLNIEPYTFIKNKKRIDNYYISIMVLLYNIYNILHIKNPDIVLENKRITYKLLKRKKKIISNIDI